MPTPEKLTFEQLRHAIDHLEFDELLDLQQVINARLRKLKQQRHED